MTAPDAPQVEPLALTLEELVIELSVDDCFLLRVGDTWSVYALQWPECPTNIGIGSTPWEAASRALDRPFVPRDDTAELVGVLQELRARFHAAGRRPEECYEMSLIDEALARVKGGERS